HITAKVEGTINNSTLTPGSPNQAFYAQHVKLLSGPVVPPNVPEAPYTPVHLHIRIPGVRHPDRTPAPALTPVKLHPFQGSPTGFPPKVARGKANHIEATPKGPSTPSTA